MRIFNALKADISFQFKQGFYFVYIALTFIYMVIMSLLPDKLLNTFIPLVVFSDPSVVGFFFIGGIVMLEKVQGILQYIVVTPLRTKEYLLAKVISLSLLAEAAGLAITAVTHKGSVNWVLLFIGILLSSVFFTLFGFIVAAKSNSVNQYFIKMIPYMLVVIFPCFSLIGFQYSWLLNIFPSAAGLVLVFGAFNGIGSFKAIGLILYLIIFNVLLLFYVEGVFNKSVIAGGGEND